jgi:hypothetical protein
MRPVAVLASAVPMAGVGAYAVFAHHVGAPQLPWNCPADHDFVSRWWVHGNGPAGISPAAEVHWAGSTEIAGCSTNFTATVGTVPHQGLPESLLDRFVFGTHEHNLMGALTGLWDQPDGKWVYFAVFAVLAFLYLRVMRAWLAA